MIPVSTVLAAVEPTSQIMVVVEGEWFWKQCKNGGPFATKSVFYFGIIIIILVLDLGAEKLF